MQYGLIGEHLSHSYSCEIHAKIADYRYELCELRPEEVGPFLERRAFRAINVTIPYKQTVIPYLDEISPEAERIGAVNTIVNRDGRLYGHNTDFAGMAALVRHAGIEVRGRKVLILGTGGTSRTAAAVMESLGAGQVLRVSRRDGTDTVRYEDAARLHADAQIIVNTTPVGMYPKDEGCPIDPALFPQLRGVLDAIYHPLRTNLVLDAQERGLPAEGGLYMLAAQAVYASAAFLGREPDPALIDTAFRAVRSGKRNLVLTGMPSAGKTTVGRALAALTGREFVDTDAEIVGRIGMPIADYFARAGEPAFRAVEREVIAEQSRRDGIVLATGGGSVLDGRNVRALRRNGLVVFLDRSPDKLTATSDRPLSSDPEALRRLYRERYALYCRAADLHLSADGRPEEIALAIQKEAL